MGRLQEPRLRAPGVGEGAALEAEHFGLEQSLRNGGAVDVDERAVRPRTRSMNQPGQQSLARPGLALDEHGREPTSVLLPSEEPGDLFSNGLDARAFTEQVSQVFHG